MSHARNARSMLSRNVLDNLDANLVLLTEDAYEDVAEQVRTERAVAMTQQDAIRRRSRTVRWPLFSDTNRVEYDSLGQYLQSAEAQQVHVVEPGLDGGRNHFAIFKDQVDGRPRTKYPIQVRVVHGCCSGAHATAEVNIPAGLTKEQICTHWSSHTWSSTLRMLFAEQMSDQEIWNHLPTDCRHNNTTRPHNYLQAASKREARLAWTEELRNPAARNMLEMTPRPAEDFAMDTGLAQNEVSAMIVDSGDGVVDHQPSLNGEIRAGNFARSASHSEDKSVEYHINGCPLTLQQFSHQLVSPPYSQHTVLLQRLSSSYNQSAVLPQLTSLSHSNVTSLNEMDSFSYNPSREDFDAIFNFGEYYGEDQLLMAGAEGDNTQAVEPVVENQVGIDNVASIVDYFDYNNDITIDQSLYTSDADVNTNGFSQSSLDNIVTPSSVGADCGLNSDHNNNNDHDHDNDNDNVQAGHPETNGRFTTADFLAVARDDDFEFARDFGCDYATFVASLQDHNHIDLDINLDLPWTNNDGVTYITPPQPIALEQFTEPAELIQDIGATEQAGGEVQAETEEDMEAAAMTQQSGEEKAERERRRLARARQGHRPGDFNPAKGYNFFADTGIFFVNGQWKTEFGGVTKPADARPDNQVDADLDFDVEDRSGKRWIAPRLDGSPEDRWVWKGKTFVNGPPSLPTGTFLDGQAFDLQNRALQRYRKEVTWLRKEIAKDDEKDRRTVEREDRRRRRAAELQRTGPANGVGKMQRKARGRRAPDCRIPGSSG